MILQANLLELLSGSDGKLPYFIKNGTNRFVTGFHRISFFKEVNDISDFEASKSGGTIEWGLVNKLFNKFNFFI